MSSRWVWVIEKKAVSEAEAKAEVNSARLAHTIAIMLPTVGACTTMASLMAEEQSCTNKQAERGSGSKSLPVNYTIGNAYMHATICQAGKSTAKVVKIFPHSKYLAQYQRLFFGCRFR